MVERKVLTQEDFVKVRGDDPVVLRCSIFEVIVKDDRYVAYKQPYPGCGYDDIVCRGSSFDEILPSIQEQFDEYLSWILHRMI